MAESKRQVRPRKQREPKQTDLQAAVASYCPDGSSVTFGGFIGRDCLAVVHEIIRQGRRGLTLLDDSKTDVADLLVGAGCVARWEGAYLGYGALGLSANFRRAVEEGIPQQLGVEDWSNAAMSMRFLAGSLALPYLPTRSLLGSDLVRYNPRVVVQEDPYGSGPLALVPAARPDVAFIHVQRADELGNGQVWGFTGNDQEKARAAHRVVLTCEELVSTEEIRRQGNLTIIPCYCVDAVVEVPWGCHPQSCYGYYAYDVLFCNTYQQAAQTRQGFLQWLEDYVLQCPDHNAYLARVGLERLAELQRLERQFNRLQGGE